MNKLYIQNTYQCKQNIRWKRQSDRYFRAWDEWRQRCRCNIQYL